MPPGQHKQLHLILHALPGLLARPSMRDSWQPRVIVDIYVSRTACAVLLPWLPAGLLSPRQSGRQQPVGGSSQRIALSATPLPFPS